MRHMRVAAYPASVVTTGFVAMGVLALAACGGTGAPVSQGPAEAETVPAIPRLPRLPTATPALSLSSETASATPATSVRTLELVGVALDTRLKCLWQGSSFTATTPTSAA